MECPLCLPWGMSGGGSQAIPVGTDKVAFSISAAAVGAQAWQDTDASQEGS